MNKINIESWKCFKIKDLFLVTRPPARSQTNYNDGNVAYVASGNFNNGVLKYLEPKKNELLDKGNCITVSPIDGSAFYQKDDFLGRGGAGSSIILLYNKNLNPYNGYFIATVIRAVCSKYAYSDMANKNTISNEIIKLPVDEIGNPNFLYMENYMKNLENSVYSSLTALHSIKATKKFDSLMSKWKSFKISNFFEAHLSNDDIQPKNIINGEVPLISSGKENNGIAAHIFNDTAQLWPNHTITVDMFGKAFYQDKPYYCVSHGRVNILIPKLQISEYAMKFIATAIEVVASKKYEFKEMCTGKKLLNDIIKLPVDKADNPDFLYMDNYMRHIENKANKTIKLVKII